MLPNLTLNIPAQALPALVWLVKNSVPLPGARLDQGLADWHSGNTPAPFNLYNAVITRRVENVASVNPANSALNAFLEIRLDLDFCTNFQDPIMRLGYRIEPKNDTTFVFTPRLTQLGVVSDTNGAPYAAFLNNFEVGDIISYLDPVFQYYTTDAGPWRAVVDAPGPKNLYGAVVQYNGQMRPQDIPPEQPSLTRVLVVTLSEENTAYRGNFSIFYQTLTVLPPTIPNGFLDQPFSFSLEPLSGDFPFTFTLVGGAFAEGQTLNASSGLLSGAPKSVGTFRPVIEVLSVSGLRVRFSFVYTVSTAPLTVTGKATNPIVGQPYSFTYLINGGVGPYTLDLVNGSLGPGLSIDRDNHRIVGVATTAGTRTFTLTATDSRDVTSLIDDTYDIQGS
jgi:hypothetical protein